jgi:hypothetical protein
VDTSNPKSSIFVRQTSRTNAALNRRGRPSDDFDFYADAYHRAGQTLFKEHFTPQTKNDLDALPICFMYRHAAELYLKGIARRGNELLLLHGKPQVVIRQTHRLTLLMDDVRPIFEFLGLPWDVEHRGQPSLAEVRRCLGDLERDDALGTDDSQGDMWRYPVHARSDKSHLPFQFNFDVAEFVNRLDPLLEVLAWAGNDLDLQLWNLHEELMGRDGDDVDYFLDT